MKLARVLLLLSTASGMFAQISTWDNSGNGMLNGTYYFRQVMYQLSNAGTGALYDAASLYGTVTFSGTGTYTMNAVLADGLAGQLQSWKPTGTYSVAASGQALLSSPLYSSDVVYGLVNAQGIFVGSSTENVKGYHDVLIAAPLSSPMPTAATFKGSYSLAYLSPDANPLYSYGGMLQANPDGAGNLGNAGFAAYVGQTGSAKTVQTLSNVKYTFSNGAAVVTFPNSTTALLSGQYYLYFSPDGNFVFGGSPVSFDMFVGVRTGTGTPNLSGLYYEAGVDEDESTLSSIPAYASLDSYYGSFSANGGVMVGHQRLLNFFNDLPYNYTYSDSYTVPSSGAYSNSVMNYVVGNGIRVGSGIGPYLGITVGLQAPAMTSSLSASGVFLNPQGIVNAGSSAPFTAGLAPGELLTLYGENLASVTQVAADVPFPTKLGNVQVSINGVAAPLYYVTPTQLSAIVPYGITGSVAKVQVTNRDVISNAVTALIAQTAPGVLTQSQNGLGYGDVVHSDGTLVNAKNPAQIGETVSVFLTGLGAVSPTIADGAAGPTDVLAKATGTITAFIGGVQATVGYSGLAPQLAGLYQINLTVPAGVTAGDSFLDIAGPDSYSSVSAIAIAGASTASSAAVTPHRAVPRARSQRGAIVPKFQ